MGPLRTGAAWGGETSVRAAPRARENGAGNASCSLCRPARRARAVREGTAIWKPGCSLIRWINTNVLAGEKLSGTRNGARSWAWGEASRR